MSQVALFLLGSPRLEWNGEPVKIAGRKAVALLAYLAVTGASQRRETLATLLWPESAPSHARAELRRALSALRHALGDRRPSPSASLNGLITADRETVGLDPDAGIRLDVQQFQSLLRACREHDHPQADVCEECLPLLAEAAELYRDDFLAGFSLRDSLQFDDWQFFQAESLRNQLADALERLVRGHATKKAYETAITYARRWVALDPLHEPAQRQLMRLYAWSGQRAAALRQYAECARTLDEELGAPPEEGTTALFQAIKAGRERPPTAEHPAVPQPIVAGRPRHNLPVQLTPFVGREGLLVEIAQRLEDPGCRLLTLVGPGGCGKTRLALEVGAARLDANAHEHGVFFVSLAPLDSADAIVPTVAEALGFPFYDAGGGPEIDLRQELLANLRHKNLLLIMDNYEHLLAPLSIPPAGGEERGGAELVAEILRTAPEVKILATSRAGLNVGGEHRFPVGGMDYPESPLEAATDATDYSAVKLFFESARRAQPGFELTDENVSDVVEICHLVEGMPLGIQLAAAWVELLTPAEISAEIGRTLDFLETDRRDVPERQRSMRAAFDHSWNLLTEREREVLQALSIFRGGFTRQAAQRVTGAMLRELRVLVDRSLLHRTPGPSTALPSATLRTFFGRRTGGRYELHELLRQYAAEKLNQRPAALEAAGDRHSAYYAAALQGWAADLKGDRPSTALAEMDVEIENARAAWDRAVEQGHIGRLDRAMDGLFLFYEWRVRLQEGEAACRKATEKWLPMATGNGAVASTSLCSGMLAPSTPLTLPLAPPGTPWHPLAPGGATAGGDASQSNAEGLRVLSRILTWQSIFSRRLGRIEVASQLLGQSLSLLDEPELVKKDTRSERAFALASRGWLAHETGAYGEAKQLAEEALVLRRALGEKRGLAQAHQLLGWINMGQGQLEESERWLREYLVMSQELGDQAGVWVGLAALGGAVFWLGRCAESRTLFEEAVAIFDDLGMHHQLVHTSAQLGSAKMMLGWYEQARTLLQRGVALARDLAYKWGIGHSLHWLGQTLLAEEAYAEALHVLGESAAICRETDHRDALGWALAGLGSAARGLGDLHQARGHLHEALQIGCETGAFRTLILALPATASFLADQGEEERAVELYALASRYPFVANSRWFEDVAGRHIAAAAEMLSPQVVAAAQERGRARDLHATVAELLEDLQGLS